MAQIQSSRVRSKIGAVGIPDISGGTISGRIDEYILKALPQDLVTVLRGVSLQELNDQIGIGNNPTQVLVDSRPVGARGIVEAKKSVSMRFADASLLLSAIRAIYELLQVVTRIQVPPQNNIVARQNFYLYIDGKNAGLLPGAFSRLRPTEVTPETVLRVVGPLVRYGRKSYWRPVGRSKVMDFRTITGGSGRIIHRYDGPLSPRFKPYRMRTIRKAANAMPGDKASNLKKLLSLNPGSVEGVGQIVKRVMRRERKYAPIYVSDGWIKYPPAKSWGKKSKDDRVPSVSAQMAKRGGVRVIKLL